MLDWLIGKKEEKPQKKKESGGELSQDEMWIYDYMRSYLTSPIWRNPLMDFIEEHCLVFEDSEQNKFEYTKIFQEFTGLTALLLESMIDEVGITEAQLEKCIIRGLRRDKDSKIFKQILLCDNFESFKKVMVQKNKELEVEAMRKMQEKVPAEKKEQAEAQIAIDSKELQRLELEKAIAMSLAVAQKSEEDKQLEEAIKLSQAEYEKKVQPKKEESPKKSPLGPLPPLVLSTNRQHRPMKEYKQEQSKLKDEILDLRKKEQARQAKAKEDQEGTEERKKRLQEQRELIRKQKQQQRKEQLKEFVKSEPQPQAKQEVSAEELERRRNLMKKLKEQLKD